MGLVAALLVLAVLFGVVGFTTALKWMLIVAVVFLVASFFSYRGHTHSH